MNNDCDRNPPRTSLFPLLIPLESPPRPYDEYDFAHAHPSGLAIALVVHSVEIPSLFPY